MVNEVLETGLTEVRLWGSNPAVGRGNGAGPARHHLSIAARAFKAHALLAAEAPGDASAAEVFRMLAAAKAGAHRWSCPPRASCWPLASMGDDAAPTEA